MVVLDILKILYIVCENDKMALKRQKFLKTYISTFGKNLTCPIIMGIVLKPSIYAAFGTFSTVKKNKSKASHKIT